MDSAGDDSSRTAADRGPDPALEAAFDAARADGRELPRLLECLLDARLWAIHVGAPAGPEAPRLRLRTFVAEGDEFYALFTSFDRLSPWLPSGDLVVRVTGRTFLEAIRGHAVVIDPGCDHCLELSVAQVSALVDGRG